MRAKVDPPGLDRRIAALADLQHGVVSRGQLLELGVSAAAIQRRVGAGRLYRIYRGVYAVGRRRIQRKGWWMAATLTTGGALSHRSAAGLWAVINPIERDEVTVPSRGGRGERRGLTIHRTSSLPGSEITTHDGIAVTTVPRTFVDLAEIVGRRKLERALDEAEYRRMLDLIEIRATIEAQCGRVGAKRLAAAIEEHTSGTTRTNEGLEERFFLLCRERGLPDPVVKARLGPYEVDFLWPEAKLVVETDDRSHERSATYESDRDRDAHLQKRGYRVRRVTSKKLAAAPDEVVRSLKAFLRPPAADP